MVWPAGFFAGIAHAARAGVGVVALTLCDGVAALEHGGEGVGRGEGLEGEGGGREDEDGEEGGGDIHRDVQGDRQVICEMVKRCIV